jgi:iron complex transport system permease protein
VVDEPVKAGFEARQAVDENRIEGLDGEERDQSDHGAHFELHLPSFGHVQHVVEKSVLAIPHAFAVLAIAGAWMLARAERLDRLGLGTDTATALGVDVPRLRRAVMLAVVALTAATVAVAGMIGFVGLIAPHIARRWVGASVRRCLPAAALGGAGMVIIADLAARTAIAPREVPVGLVTALVGGPFFLWQLQRRTA